MATVTLTSSGGEARTASIVVGSAEIKVTANSKTKVFYSNEPIFRALCRYLSEDAATFTLN